MFSKIDVNGTDAHPLYQFLRMHSPLYTPEDKTASEIPWNFAKFLVDADGKVVHYHGPRDNPLSFTEEIEKMLWTQFYSEWHTAKY